MKQPSYKNFFLNVDRKVIYFIWVRLKCRKKKLKQRLKKVYQIYSGIIRHDGNYNITFILTNTKPRIRIPKNQCLPNTTSRCLILASPSKVIPT